MLFRYMYILKAICIKQSPVLKGQYLIPLKERYIDIYLYYASTVLSNHFLALPLMLAQDK